MEMIGHVAGFWPQERRIWRHIPRTWTAAEPRVRAYPKPRFAQWIIDMCTRERDQARLDCQYLIGARHRMSAAKNAAD